MQGTALSYCVRLMRKEDIPQVDDIDREAFSTQWPPPNYAHELQSRMAHYIVAYDADNTATPPPAAVKPTSSGLSSALRRFFMHDHSSDEEVLIPKPDHIVGFAGFWIMAEEAHITSIAVRETCRRRGIGELMMISVIDMAKKLNIRVVTMEVRVSSTPAQSLYIKYGFNKVGVRRGYYTDNREDAAIMTTEDITTTAFQTRLMALKQAYSQKYGETIS